MAWRSNVAAWGTFSRSGPCVFLFALCEASGGTSVIGVVILSVGIAIGAALATPIAWCAATNRLIWKRRSHTDHDE